MARSEMVRLVSQSRELFQKVELGLTLGYLKIKSTWRQRLLLLSSSSSSLWRYRLLMLMNFVQL